MSCKRGQMVYDGPTLQAGDLIHIENGKWVKCNCEVQDEGKAKNSN